MNRRVVRDKRQNATRYDYDDANRVTRVTDPEPYQGQTVETSYDDPGNRVSERDRRLITKVTQMDALGRVVKVTRAGVVLERSAYDGVDNKVLATDGEGRKTQLVYDGAGRLSRQVDGFEGADAATTEYRYDASGNRTLVIDPRSTEAEPSARMAYDELNRLTDEWDGEGNRTHYGYDAEGNRISEQEPRLMTTSFEYDELGKLTKVIQPAVEAGIAETRQVYDPARNRTDQYDGRNKRVKMEYDLLNRVKKTTQDPGGLDLVTETLSFDANGNPEQVRDANGQTITSTYDELNRLKTKAYAARAGSRGPGANHAHRRTSTTPTATWRGSRTTWPAARIRRRPPLVTTRGYDTRPAGERDQALPDGGSRRSATRTSRTARARRSPDPAGLVTQYTYDGQNRLQTASRARYPQGTDHDYTYYPDDLLHTVAYPNGVVATHGYDKADRLTSLVNARAATTCQSFTPSRTTQRQPPVPGRDQRRPDGNHEVHLRRSDRLETVTTGRRELPVRTGGHLRLRRRRKPDPRDRAEPGRRRPCGQARRL